MNWELWCLKRQRTMKTCEFADHETNGFTSENGKCNLYATKEFREINAYFKSLSDHCICIYFDYSYSEKNEFSTGTEKAMKIASGTKILSSGEGGRAWLV